MNHEYGKCVKDLEIDTDHVLLSNDISCLSNDILSGATDAIRKNISSYIDIAQLSGNVYEAVKLLLDDYVLRRMLSTYMFDILSTYNDTVVDCLDGTPMDGSNIYGGGAY